MRCTEVKLPERRKVGAGFGEWCLSPGVPEVWPRSHSPRAYLPQGEVLQLHGCLLLPLQHNADPKQAPLGAADEQQHAGGLWRPGAVPGSGAARHHTAGALVSVHVRVRRGGAAPRRLGSHRSGRKSWPLTGQPPARCVQGAHPVPWARALVLLGLSRLPFPTVPSHLQKGPGAVPCSCAQCLLAAGLQGRPPSAHCLWLCSALGSVSSAFRGPVPLPSCPGADPGSRFWLPSMPSSPHPRAAEPTPPTTARVPPPSLL